MQHARACRAPGFHGNAAHRWQQALRVVCLFLPQAGTLVVAVHHVVQAGAACTPSACCEWQLVDAIAVAGIAHQNSRSAGRPVALRHGHTLTNVCGCFVSNEVGAGGVAPCHVAGCLYQSRACHQSFCWGHMLRALELVRLHVCRAALVVLLPAVFSGQWLTTMVSWLSCHRHPGCF